MCIRDRLVEEVVLFDAEQKAFYPVKDKETLQIGSYGLAVSYDSGDYRIDVYKRQAHRPFRAGRPENHRKARAAGIYLPPPHPPRSRGKRSVCGAAFSL